jgi:hypothetical protein
VDKAAARLPRLDDTAQRVFNETVVNLTRDKIAALQAHLQHFNRVKATESSLAQKLAVGDSVKIVGGETKYTGREGTVLKVQRIRCYVEVEGASKPVYLFTSDVERFEAESPSIAKAS